MNFTKEQIDYVKKTLDHIDFLTGSSRNSKTKQIIEELQQENARLKEFKKEHDIMKKILIEKGLWETLLNDDRFLEHLREEN